MHKYKTKKNILVGENTIVEGHVVKINEKIRVFKSGRIYTVK